MPMPRPRIPALIALVVALAVPAVAAADVHSYVQVDEVSLSEDPQDDSNGVYLIVEGVRNGSVQRFSYYRRLYSTSNNNNRTIAETCHKQAMLALSKPGRYRLDIQVAPWNGGTSGQLQKCTLRRLDAPRAP